MKNKLNTLLCFVLALLMWGKALGQQIQHLEPTFWWVGMQNPELQLMVHGENIAALSPEVDYPGVRLVRTITVENPNYLFIDFHISEDAAPGEMTIDFNSGSNSVLKYTYQLLPRETGSAEREGFTTSDVMYLITPDRFVNGNPANDNVKGMAERADRNNKGGRHGGDIAGIIQSLDYIEEMGFTAIWVNPVLENDQPEYSYHGYSTTDFYKVDARFGSNEEYLSLSRQANERGIKLIMDMIMNHCGSEHWWMQDLPASDWINHGNEFVPTSHKRTTVQDPYASEADLQAFTDGWFVKTMPDLNQRNPLLAKYLIQNTIWWIEYAQLSGIRMDTYPYPDKQFMADWTCAVMAEYPNFNIVGEEWSTNPAIVAYWQKGKANHDGYTSCLPSLMDFPLQHALLRGLTEKENYNTGLINLYEGLATDFLYADPSNLVVFPDNHDMDRFFTQVGEDPELFKMGIAYTLTVRGIPQIYYGSEIMMGNSDSPGDHGIIRTDFPSGWTKGEANALTGHGLSQAQKEMQAFFRKLLNWRKHNATIHGGRLMHYAPADGAYTLFRYDGERVVMLAFNKSDRAVELSMGRFKEVLCAHDRVQNVLSGEHFALPETMKLPAKGLQIWEVYSAAATESGK